MFGIFGRKAPKLPAMPRGFRAYAVGDVHGRLDLLDRMLAEIVADARARGRAKNLLIFLGDLIDRGPQSAQVLERLRLWQADGWKPVFLMGNHEEVMLRVLEGDCSLLRRWLQFGGAECLQSYGLNPAWLDQADDGAALSAVREAIPATHVNFVRSFNDTLSIGDYLFVHAGIRPGIALEDQAKADLRWIREPFLSHEDAHEAHVVHGHTIFEDVQQRDNRTGIDTGAYRTHLLTALGLEEDRRWFLQPAAAQNRVGRETILDNVGCVSSQGQ